MKYPQDLVDKFWEKVTVSDGCWEWSRALNKAGYGIGHFRGIKTNVAHRISYLITKGDIPEGLQIDHLCMNRKCVNPGHLEAVTQMENINRAVFSKYKVGTRQTHCINGHERTEINTKLIFQSFRCTDCMSEQFVNWKVRNGIPIDNFVRRGPKTTKERGICEAPGCSTQQAINQTRGNKVYYRKLCYRHYVENLTPIK